MAGTSLRRNPTTTSLITGLESTRDGTIAVRDGTGLRPQTFGVRLYQPRATSVNSGAFSSHLPVRVLVRQRSVAFHSFASRRYFRRSTGQVFHLSGSRADRCMGRSARAGSDRGGCPSPRRRLTLCPHFTMVSVTPLHHQPSLSEAVRLQSLPRPSPYYPLSHSPSSSEALRQRVPARDT